MGGLADGRIAVSGRLRRLPIRPSAHPPLGPDDRVLITDFTEVDAVAASPWFVFAATRHGLVIYDRAMRRFRPPVTVLHGYPASGLRVRRAIADPSGSAVWLDLSGGGDYARYDVDGRAWTRGGIPSWQVDGSLTVDAALASAPLADAMRAVILTDKRLRTYRFTAAAATPDRAEIFFGTNGLGLVRVDKQTGEWEVLTYGLIAPAVGAVGPAPGGVWAATRVPPGAVRDRRGLTWVADDLSATRSTEGGGAALGFTFLYSRRLLRAGDDLWLATEQGVLRIDPSTFDSRLFDVPDATSLAPARDGIWVGTARGLSKITTDGEVRAIGPVDLPVVSLLAAGDTLWVGTSLGLGQVLPGTDAVTTPPELADRPSLRVTVHALGRLQDTIIMTTERELWWRDPSARTWSSLPLPLTLGVPTALAATSDRGVWIGGLQGLAQADLARRLIHVLTVPYEIPAPVRDVLTDREFIWAATDSGLVRIR